jgi:hypothetical protein
MAFGERRTNLANFSLQIWHLMMLMKLIGGILRWTPCAGVFALNAQSLVKATPDVWFLFCI